MLHFDAEAAALQQFVPPGTELDLWRGRPIVSVVGLLSRHTRVLGVVPAAIPASFVQVNLRTYVRRPGRPGEPHVGLDGHRHGVVFLRELVPRPLLAACARAYGEPYVTAPTSHEFAAGRVRYGWKLGGGWSELVLDFDGSPTPLQPGTEAEFLAMRHWGYSRRGPRTRECRVEHSRWHHWVADAADLSGGFGELVPPWLAEVLSQRPRSAYLAAGSTARLYHGETFA
jgi:hypothetical protein